MNVLLFLITIIISFVVVRVGAIAFELTGLEWSLAKFQALSCFSGTGFTTKEAELVVGHPRRRQIATVLMVLGNAGLVTLIATLANTMRPESALTGIPALLKLPVPASVLPYINLAVILVAGYILFRVLRNATVLRRITDYLRHRVSKSQIISRVSVEQLMIATGGYGVVSVDASGPVIGKSLRRSGLRDKDITVLTLERDGEVRPNPGATTEIREGDRLVCFGKTDAMKAFFGAGEDVEAGDDL